jgi:hypothetical protein
VSPVDPDFWTEMEEDEANWSALERLLRSDPEILDNCRRHGWLADTIKKIDEERGT